MQPTRQKGSTDKRLRRHGKGVASGTVSQLAGKKAPNGAQGETDRPVYATAAVERRPMEEQQARTSNTLCADRPLHATAQPQSTADVSARGARQARWRRAGSRCGRVRASAPPQVKDPDQLSCKLYCCFLKFGRL